MAFSAKRKGLFGHCKPIEKRQKLERVPVCVCMQRCREFLDSLALDAAYFDPQYDRCYCQTCATTIPDLLETDRQHGQPYEVPKGWCGFGLAVPPRARAERVFDEWVVSFHGCPMELTPSILRQGELLMPGDTLLNGTQLPNRLTRGGEERVGLYTSPSIKYSELDIYTQPASWKGHKVRLVIQCRQKPGSFRAEGETVSWQGRFGDARISQHFTNQEIERFTHARGSIIPSRVLVSMDGTTREDEETDRNAARKQQKELRKQLVKRFRDTTLQVRVAEKLALAADAASAAAEAARAEAHKAAGAAMQAVKVAGSELCNAQPKFQDAPLLATLETWVQYWGELELFKKPQLGERTGEKVEQIDLRSPMETPAEEAAKVKKKVEQDRKDLVDATIVRLMKAARMMRHNDLFEAVCNEVERLFRPEHRFIKERIDHLLAFPYIERDQNIIGIYHYVP